MRCFSAFKTVCIGLTLLLGPLSAAALQWPAPQTVMDQTADLIRYMVAINGAGRVDGERLALPEQVSRFYMQREFRPAWLDREGIFLEGGELLQALRSAAQEGLRPEDYPVAAIEQRLYGTIDDPLQLAQLDLLLTDAFLHYSRNLRTGRVDPRSAELEWHIPLNPFAPDELLLEALTTRQVYDTLAALPPPHPGYQRLRAALARYRALAAEGGWPMVVPGPILRLGMRDERVAQLRERLLRSGELKEAAAEPALFDSALRQAVRRFQRRHGLKGDGSVGEATLAALNVPAVARLRQIEANLERWRWLPRELPGRHLVVNMAGFELELIEGQQRVMAMRVIVGRDYRQTPVFVSQMTSLVLNPYWYVPRTIFREDILPVLRADPGYLQRMRLRLFSSLAGNGTEADAGTIDWGTVDGERFPYVLRQEPGPHNALGTIKFMLPNRYGIFLHDTPHRGLFNEPKRAFSSGCIRLEDPLALAEYMLAGQPGWDRAALEAAIAQGRPQTLALPVPLPVYLMYWTAWVDAEGEVQFRDDIYGRDLRLLQALLGAGAPVVARRPEMP